MDKSKPILEQCLEQCMDFLADTKRRKRSVTLQDDNGNAQILIFDADVLENLDVLGGVQDLSQQLLMEHAFMVLHPKRIQKKE